MLVIRYFRVGKKNQPSFKIVVTDKTKPPRAGRFVEEIGFYNPITKEKVLKAERAKYWISVGAKPSPTVYNLLVSEKIVEGKKIFKHKKSKKKVEGAPAPEVKPAEDLKTEKNESSEAAVPVEKETEKPEIKEQSKTAEVKTESISGTPTNKEMAGNN